jgi:hypothetical protein
MTSGIYSPTSMGMVDGDSRLHTHLSARLTARPSTRKYLEPFQILASAGADSRAAADRGGRFSNTGAGAKSKGFEGIRSALYINDRSDNSTTFSLSVP